MDTHLDHIAANCFRLASADGSWQSIGFGSRPRRGLIWRLTTPVWKVALEQRMNRELLIAFSAAHLAAFNPRDDLLRGLVDFYWGDDGGRFGRAFDFQSKESCRQAIEEYLDGNSQTLLWHHLDITTIPDKRLRARLMIGVVEFGMSLSMIQLRIKSCGVDMTNWPAPKATLEEAVRDDMDAVNRIFEETKDSAARSDSREPP